MRANILFDNIVILQTICYWEEVDTKQIDTNSNNCTAGSLFVCIKGVNTDGHNYAYNAINNGATLLVVEQFVPDVSVPQIKVENARAALSLLASAFYNYPSKQLKLIGVTGTNGKTTTTYLIKHMLECCNQKVGLIGTEGVWIDGQHFKTDLTTPDPLELHQHMHQMVNAGCTHCVMEVSAHAIAFDKTEGLDFEIGLLTNISQDHLDFFETMEHYAQTKLNFMASPQVKLGIVNADDERATSLKNHATKNIVFFGKENPSDVFCASVELRPNGATFFVNAYDEVERVISPLCGEFNVSNVLGAIACGLHLGFALGDVCASFKTFAPIPGRFEVKEMGNNRYVVIDFAHTPVGMEKLLQAAHQFCPKPLICLFGCSGNRDRAKRPIMGKIAEEYADFVIVSSDNPKYEKPEFIMFEICKGLKKSNHILIPDRKVAVAIALEYLSHGGTLVLCGKGAEQYQDINGTKVPYSDLQEVNKFVLQEQKSLQNEAKRC